MRRFVLLVIAVAVAGCAPGDVVIDRTFDVCEPIGVDAHAATAAERDGVEAALALWRARGITTVTEAPLDADVTIPIVFEAANPTFHGYYDDEAAVIYVNVDLEADARAITIAHELGHAFGLYHVDVEDRRSLMNPHNLSIPPTDEDARAVALLWGACPVGASADASVDAARRAR